MVWMRSDWDGECGLGDRKVITIGRIVQSNASLLEQVFEPLFLHQTRDPLNHDGYIVWRDLSNQLRLQG